MTRVRRDLVCRAARRLLSAFASLLVGAAAAAATPLPVEKLRVPPGFRVELVTADVPDAREMALGRFAGDRGIVYVGSRGAGKVYAVVLDGGRATDVRTVASGLQMPSGIAWRDGRLYIAAVSKILRLDGIDDRIDHPPSPVVVTDRLPGETHHGWKFIAFGPDGKLYVPVGAPCNVCVPDDRHGLIERMNVDGSGEEVVARGVRNSVGFDWSPADRTLWFTDNGRDMMGDDMPSDELDHVAPQAAKAPPHFGFPYCHQGDTLDPELGRGRACSEFVAPKALLGAHVAAIGMRFYRGAQFPKAYQGSIYIAEHGSWNRSRKSGYQVARVPVDADGRAGAPEPFVQGWLQISGDGRESVWGRPTDVLPLPDGSLLVSDDLAGAIYRVRYAP